MSYNQKLLNAIRAASSCLCVGLDPNIDRIPFSIKQQYSNPVEQVSVFLKKVIDQTSPYCAAFKPNLGFFEALGGNGLPLFQQLLNYIPDDKIVIADAKRGDISSTAEHYAHAYFKVFDVDAITINPLMGFETLTPFLDYPDKAVYTLALTSNPGASDFLMQPFAGKASMAQYIANKLHQLNERSKTHLGMVAGATQAKQLAPVIEAHESASLLIPGIGTQGGSVGEMQQLLHKYPGLPLFNASRSILYAGENAADWKIAVKKQAIAYQQALKPITNNL